MRQQKKTSPLVAENSFGAWRTMLWLIIFGATLFFWPACLDRYLAPRFFFLSAAILISIFWLWKDLNKQNAGRWKAFDLLLLGWYGMNLASISWSLSWSEGIFYAQKTLLLFGVYWLLRKALLHNEVSVRIALARITLALTVLICLILLVQVGIAATKNGLDNETLYDFASGVFGNKSLAGEFLCLLLVLNGLFVANSEKLAEKRLVLWVIFGVLLTLILVLQVRTALLATIIGGTVYLLARSVFEPGFRRIFVRRILPLGFFALSILMAVLAWKGQISTIGTRLNPMNYLESDTANERRFVWYKTDQLNKDHFWLGVGNGSWKFWLPSKDISGGYRLAESNIVFTRAHNDYLEIRAEMGIVGVVWYCALFGIAFLAAILAFRQNQVKGHPELNHDILLGSVGLIGYCIIQYFDFPRERIEFQVVLGVFFAILSHKSGNFWSISSPKLETFVRLLLIAGLTLNLVIGGSRIQGEIHNVRLMEAQSKSDWRRVTEEATKAENLFYEYTDAAIPLAWHEGVAWFQLGNFEKSATALERAYRLNPWSFQVINNYASALVKLKRFPEAILLFEKALSINPRYDEGKFNLSFVYMQMNDLTRSGEWLAKVDTIKAPGNEADREKNRKTLKRLREFQKVLEGMKK